MRHAPDTVLVHVKASAEVIRARMRDNPHRHGVLKEEDVNLVIQRFQEEFDRSLLRRRMTLDTSTATVEETFAEFVEKYEHHMGEEDRRRILTHRLWRETNPLGT